MLRKEKSKSQHLSPSDNQPPRPTRKSFPDTAAPDKASLSTDQPRRKKSADKRKVSRVHLGRLQFLSEDLVEDDPDPDQPVQLHDFFMAASSGKIKTVTKYLDEGGDVNTVDSCDRTALHRASLYEQIAIVNLLIDKGANVNLADMLSNTPLHWACRGSSLEVVQTLVASKAKVNKKDQLQNTPLHVATRVGFVDCVDYLLECGARINEKDSEGDTPIHDAIRLARPKVVRTLILHGANMSIKNMNSKTASDMMQAWYNTTKEAILNAEKERKRKCLDVEKLTKELQQDEEDVSNSAPVNIKKFSIESYESWKEDLMNCGGGKSNLVRKASQESMPNPSITAQAGNHHSNDAHLLLPLAEEDEINTESTDPSLPVGQPLTVEASLSSEDQKGLTKMEKATPIIKENMIFEDRDILNQEETKAVDI